MKLSVLENTVREMRAEAAEKLLALKARSVVESLGRKIDGLNSIHYTYDDQTLLVGIDYFNRGDKFSNCVIVVKYYKEEVFSSIVDSKSSFIVEYVPGSNSWEKRLNNLYRKCSKSKK